MGRGLRIGASGDHPVAGAHARLNRAGFVAMALFAVCRRLAARAARSRFGRLHAALAIGGVALRVPGLAVAGGLVRFAPMLDLLLSVLVHGPGPRETGTRAAPAAAVPAE